jgi:transposase
MEQVITIGLDIAKHVFHAHGVDERGASCSASGSVGVGCCRFSVASRAA